MINRADSGMAFQEKALGLRAYRQQVLAGNIANADTPNYKARDFDFASALKDAVAGRQTGDLALARTSPRHLNGTAGTGTDPRLLYRTPAQDSADGNTVDMDVERAQFSENAVHYEAGLSFLSGRIKTMLAAIQGQ